MAIVYVAVALLALMARRTSNGQRERSVWAVTAVVLVMFGVAKQLDVQEILTDWLRTFARAHQIYESRTILQLAFLLVILPAVWFIVVRLKAWLASSSLSLRVATFAMALLVAFVLARAASLHLLDPVTGTTIAGLRCGWWVELAGLSVVAFAAVASVRENHPT